MKKLYDVGVFVACMVVAASVCSAEPLIDFDGKTTTGNNTKTISYETLPQDLVIIPAKPYSADIIATLQILNDKGELIEVPPIASWLGENGIKIIQYTVEPNTAVRWMMGCPNEGVWTVSHTYAYNPNIAGHAHFSPPPGPLWVSHSQSTNVPTDFQQTPSPIAFPAMDGLSRPYYYWVGYEGYATRIVAWYQYSGACSGTYEYYFDVKIPGLVEMSPGTGYVLVGTTTIHPYSHSVSTGFNTVLQDIGKEWKKTCPNSRPLEYNDASLPWGGVMDLNQDWKPPHSGHNKGLDIDVSKIYVRNGNREKLLKTMCDKAKVRSEGDEPKEPSPHYHVSFKPKNDTELDDSDEKFINCCVTPRPQACIDLQSNGTSYAEVLPVATDCR